MSTDSKKTRNVEPDDRRVEGTAQEIEGKVPTYQQALDEALEESFPASDPISPGVAEKAEREVSTPKDDKDWKLNPGKDKKG